MRPSGFEIISWAKLEVSALFQSAQHVRSMFSYKSVNGTNNARPKSSKKNGNFQKKIFYPKMMFFFIIPENFFVKFLCLMKTILCHTHKKTTTKKQEAHGPRVAHLSDIATADMQMLCNIFPVLSSQLMKRSSFK